MAKSKNGRNIVSVWLNDDEFFHFEEIRFDFGGHILPARKTDIIKHLIEEEYVRLCERRQASKISDNTRSRTSGNDQGNKEATEQAGFVPYVGVISPDDPFYRP